MLGSQLSKTVTFLAVLTPIQYGGKNRSKLTDAVIIEVNTDVKRYIFGSVHTHSVWGKEQVNTDGCRY